MSSSIPSDLPFLYESPRRKYTNLASQNAKRLTTPQMNNSKSAGCGGSDKANNVNQKSNELSHIDNSRSSNEFLNSSSGQVSMFLNKNISMCMNFNYSPCYSPPGDVNINQEFIIKCIGISGQSNSKEKNAINLSAEQHSSQQQKQQNNDNNQRKAGVSKVSSQYDLDKPVSKFLVKEMSNESNLPSSTIPFGQSKSNKKMQQKIEQVEGDRLHQLLLSTQDRLQTEGAPWSLFDNGKSQEKQQPVQTNYFQQLLKLSKSPQQPKHNSQYYAEYQKQSEDDQLEISAHRKEGISLEEINATQSKIANDITQNIAIIDELNAQICEELNASFESVASIKAGSQTRMKESSSNQLKSCSRAYINRFCTSIEESAQFASSFSIHNKTSKSPSISSILLKLNQSLSLIKEKQDTQDNAIFTLLRLMKQAGSQDDVCEQLQLNLGGTLDQMSRKSFHCKFCSKIFPKSCSLGGHISRVHKGRSDQYKEKQKVRQKREMERMRKTYFKKKGEIIYDEQTSKASQKKKRKQQTKMEIEDEAIIVGETLKEEGDSEAIFYEDSQEVMQDTQNKSPAESRNTTERIHKDLKGAKANITRLESQKLKKALFHIKKPISKDALVHKHTKRKILLDNTEDEDKYDASHSSNVSEYSPN